MLTTPRRTYSPVLLVTIATVPLLLAAITVSMVRKALSSPSDQSAHSTSLVTPTAADR